MLGVSERSASTGAAVTIPECLVTLQGRGIRLLAMAEAAGVSQSSVTAWKAGKWLPDVKHATLIAERYDYPEFLAAVKAARTISCVKCSKPFLAPNFQVGKARYCSRQCEYKTKNARFRGPRKALTTFSLTESLKKARRRIAMFEAATARNCLPCEPEGVCRTAECPWHELTKHTCIVDCEFHRKNRQAA